MKIYIVKVSNIEKTKFNQLLSLINLDKKTCIDKFIYEKDKITALFSEMLLRTRIFKDFELNNNEAVISKNSYGKPYLVGANNLYFNISHSGKLVVCATDNKPVGIDIEEIKDIDYQPIIKGFFSKNDIDFILNVDLEKRLNRFYEIWTLKESYIKAKGKGLSIPLDSFSFNFDYYDNITLISNDNRKYIFKVFDVIPEYKMAVCSLNNEITDEIIEINQGILIEEYCKLVNTGVI